MSSQGMAFIGIASLLTFLSNFLLRTGVRAAGGFLPSHGTVFRSLIGLARQPLFVAGVLLYIAGALIWFRVISTENLNVSYPALVGMTFLLVTIGSTVFFKEPVSPLKILGLGLILAGILVVSST
jgi:multidrug transporter EmrE-like cation transporter